MDHTANVFDVLRSSGEDFRNDQILRTDDRHKRAIDIDGDGAPEELLFESRPGEYDIERHAARTMNEREYTRACHEFGIVDDGFELVAAHRVGVMGERFRFDGGGDVDIRAQAGASPDDCGLCTEHVPLKAAFIHSGGEGMQEVNDAATFWQDEGFPKPGCEQRDPRADPLRSASRCGERSDDLAAHRRLPEPQRRSCAVSARPNDAA